MATSRFGLRLTVFSIIWLLLTEWQLSALPVGSIFIIAASLLSFYLAPTQRTITQPFKISAKALSFLFYFAEQSLRGGWGIAKLALKPKLGISPGFFLYRTSLSNESQLFTFMQVLSLLPGTVSVGREGSDLSIHVLDLASFNHSDVEDCHRWVIQFIYPQKEFLSGEKNS